jgi:IclR family KDG regulon transcriptional repressor
MAKIPQIKVSRMLRTLEDDAFFERNKETGKYRLGSIFFELGLIYAFHFPLRRIMRPHIEEIARKLNGTASWSILKNDKIIVMDRAKSLNHDVPAYRIGLNPPIHCTCAGRLLMAHVPEEEQDRILQVVDLVKYTDTTLVDPELIKENLKLVKEQGYADCQGEIHKDLGCVAAPVKDSNSEVIAAVNILYMRSQTEEEERPQIIDYMIRKSLFVSRQLGYGDVG